MTRLAVLRRAVSGRGRGRRGAVAPLIAVAMTLMIVSAAFAVDLGMQRVLRRDLQALADVVALDLSRALPGKTAVQMAALAPAIVSETLARNSSTLGDDDSTTADDPVVEFRFGKISAGSDGSTVFVERTGNAVVSAVEVRASSVVDFSFAPGSGAATRTAIGVPEGGACFSVGSYAATLDTTASPLLGSLLSGLGAQLTLTAADYRALADARVGLAQLLTTQVGAVTLEEALDGSQLVSLAGFYAATITALSRQGDSAAVVSVLERVQLAAPNVTFPVADILSVSTGSGSGLASGLNVLDLVTAATSAASAEQAALASSSTVALGPVVGVQSNLRVVEPPAVGCGRAGEAKARAASSSAAVSLSSNAADVTVPGLLRTQVAAAGSVSLAPAVGTLAGIDCSPDGITVPVSGGLTNVDVTLNITVYASVLGVVVPVAQGPVRITGSNSTTGTAVVPLPDEAAYETPARVANNNSGVPVLSVNTSGFRLIGTPVGVTLAPILNALTTGLINPVVGALDSQVMTPVARSLGGDVAGADVYALPFVRCDNATLRG